MGEASRVDVVSMRVADGDRLQIDGVNLDVIYTPGHTDDSYSFLMADRVFTGDTLLIRGTGRTDFQNGDPRAQYASIFGRLLKLPDETLVYPAHDYKGDTVSTIGEERRFNPRLQVKSVDEYVELMNNLNLPDPKMMDVAVPANLKVGLAQEEIARRGWALTAAQAMAALGKPDVALIDLREAREREKYGVIPGSLHAPYTDLVENVGSGGMLHQLAATTGKRIVFYCAFGERSAMAVQAAQDAGPRVGRARHSVSYLQSTVLHEFGHTLGLDHVNGAGNSDANYGLTLDQREDLMGLGDHLSAREAQPWKSQVRHHLIPGHDRAALRFTARVTAPQLITYWDNDWRPSP
jgi:rhodanese-related sulfurtransferase